MRDICVGWRVLPAEVGVGALVRLGVRAGVDAAASVLLAATVCTRAGGIAVAAPDDGEGTAEGSAVGVGMCACDASAAEEGIGDGKGVAVVFAVCFTAA